MTFSEEQQNRIIKLLRIDATRKIYIRDYMKEYRRNKKEKTGKGQKQYYEVDDVKRRMKQSYMKKTVLNDIKYLFQ